MGLEASVQFEDEALIAAEAEFGADFVDEVEGVEAVDADEREDEFIAARREGSGVQRTLDATQMYLSEIGFSPLLTAEEERRQRVANTIGKNHADLEQLRRACVQKARVMWEADPTLRMIEVAKTCREAILNVLAKHPEKLPSMKAKDVPGEDAIKTWLREAGAAGALQIPDAAQKPGRPKKLQARADK